MKFKVLSVILLVGATLLSSAATVADVTLTNVSYDPTRELYQDLSSAFSKAYREKTGETVKIESSHGGSGKQARAVIDGLKADVVSLALAADIDAIATRGGLLSQDWQKKLPDNSTPYTSTVVFLVRKGNPKAIKDWGDLIQPGLKIVTPNPKTSGGARWNYLAAWGYALRANNNDAAKAKAFVKELYAHAPTLEQGARAATTSFVERKQGDVLLAWENEAYQAVDDHRDTLEIVVPSISILAEPPVAVMDKVVDANGTRKEAEAFLAWLYTPEAQDIIGRNFYRPRLKDVADRYKDQFKPVRLFTIDEVFGGWKKAQKEHFDDGGIFDEIIKK
jgi:sulfate/thiosulfate transport system substrate-binding protein